MRRQLITTAVLASCLLLTSGLASAQDFDSAGEQQMLARINAMRAAQSLPPLSRHDALDAAARAHSSDMASQGALTHVSESTGTPADRVRRAGVTASTIAENVALHRSAGEAHEALIGSDAHRGNMMSSDATHVGLAALRTERGVYVTQVFASIAPPAPAEAPAPIAPAIVPAPIAPAIVPGPQAPAAEAPTEPAEQGADCITPVPGVRLCGRLPARSAQPVEAPAPRVEAPPPVAAAPAAPLAGPPTHLHVQPGTNGTVVIQRTPDNSRVEGYWVYGSGRWWYYPMPLGAQAGHRLEPDMSVSGPPPGFPAHPFGPPATPHTFPAQPYRPAYPQPQAFQVAPPPTAHTFPLQPYRPAQPPPVQAPAQAQITIAPGTVFYSVPPPPMVGNPDGSWRRAHREWTRAYRRWLRDQARLRSQAL